MKIKIKQVAWDKKGYTLYKVAKKLDIPQQTVYSWGSGRTQPCYESMDKLCTLLECTMSDLFDPDLVELPSDV